MGAGGGWGEGLVCSFFNYVLECGAVATQCLFAGGLHYLCILKLLLVLIIKVKT